MATKKAVKRGPGRPPKVAKRGPGSPRKILMHVTGLNAVAESVSAAATKAVQKAIDGAFVNGEQKAPSAADLIAQLRPHIKAIDAIVSQCDAAGVEAFQGTVAASHYSDAHKFLILALARAP